MASNHPIDQLFREGLGNNEMKPSAAAWEQIQQKTQKKGVVSYLKIAASVALIFTVGFNLWITNRTDQQLAYSGEPIAIPSPTQLAYQSIIIPERTIIEDRASIKEVKEEDVLPEVEQNFTTSPSYMVMEIPTLSVEAVGIEELIVMTVEIPSLDIKNEFENKVNIFYYPQATPDGLDASKGKLAQIIDYAKTTTPAIWVGDFRNRKDDWIENVFSLDE